MYKTPNKLPALQFHIRGGNVLYYSISYLGETSKVKSTTIKIEPNERWHKQSRTIIGNEAKTLIIRQLQNDVMDTYRELAIVGKTITAQSIMDYHTDKEAFKATIPTLVGATNAFIEFEDSRHKRGQICKKTNSRYPNWRKKLTDFIKDEYKANDLTLSDIKPIFATQYESFLCGQGLKTRTVNKNLDFVRGVLDHAVKHEWINRNPLKGHRKKSPPKSKVEYLTYDEVMELYSLDIQDGTMSEVRYHFVFMCLTALNLADLPTLKVSDLKTDENGILCIDRGRTKKGDEYTMIPLIDLAKIILDRYTDYAKKTGFLIPAISLDKTNRYLKAIQAISTIRRINITTKIGRNSYSTILSILGIPLPMIMKATGHSKPETILKHYINKDKLDSSKVIHDKLNTLKRNH